MPAPECGGRGTHTPSLQSNACVLGLYTLWTLHMPNSIKNVPCMATYGHQCYLHPIKWKLGAYHCCLPARVWAVHGH